MNVKGYDITLSNGVNLLFGLMEKVFSYKFFNLWKTLYLNFRLFPFSQAIQLPIFVWGGLRIVSLIGRAEIRGRVSPGMIRFGLPAREEIVGYTRSTFSNQGTILFQGKAVFYNGFTIRVYRQKTLDLGRDIAFSSGASLLAFDDIRIGHETRMADNCLLISSDMHYSVDTTMRMVGRNSGPIILGCNNWITGRVRIMKGTVTPDWTIVTSGSVLNKDYTKTIPPESIIGGSPAKLIKTGQRRVFSLKSEGLLRAYFSETEQRKYHLKSEVDLSEFCERSAPEHQTPHPCSRP